MGGTIDKAYPKSIGGYGFEIDLPAAKDILETLNPSFSYDIVSICKKDSQDITSEDIAGLSTFLKKAKSKHIIITHGTDTMIDTAKPIEGLGLEKTIILTGASKPAAFVNSDAAAQVGYALAACQLMPFGVYVAMHGIVKKASQINRDQETGKFY